MPRREDGAIPAAILDRLLAGRDPMTVLAPEGQLERRFHATGTVAATRRRLPCIDADSPGSTDKVIALDARRLSTRDIQAHARELYGLEISPGRRWGRQSGRR